MGVINRAVVIVTGAYSSMIVLNTGFTLQAARALGVISYGSILSAWLMALWTGIFAGLFMYYWPHGRGAVIIFWIGALFSFLAFLLSPQLEQAFNFVFRLELTRFILTWLNSMVATFIGALLYVAVPHIIAAIETVLIYRRETSY